MVRKQGAYQRGAALPRQSENRLAVALFSALTSADSPPSECPHRSFHPATRALAARLRDRAVDPALIGRLRAGIPPVKTIQDDVDALTEIYEATGAGRA